MEFEIFKSTAYKYIAFLISSETEMFSKLLGRSRFAYARAEGSLLCISLNCCVSCLVESLITSLQESYDETQLRFDNLQEQLDKSKDGDEKNELKKNFFILLMRCWKEVSK